MSLIGPAPSWIHSHNLLAIAIYFARTSGDLAMIEQSLSSDMLGTHAIVALKETAPGSPVPSVAFPLTLGSANIVPYFSHQNLFFIHHEGLKRVQLTVDYSISFDTNAASYVRRIVENETLAGLGPRIEETFRLIISEDYNFDAFFYCVENIKQGYSADFRMKQNGNDSPTKLWELLNEDFRQNLVCIQRFNAVDCELYRRSGGLRFDLSYEEAVRDSIRFAYEFYTTREGKELINDLILPLHRLFVLQLLGMLKIQFSSKSSSSRKLKRFLDFVHQKGEVYLDRETRLAFRYFQNPGSVPLFNKLNRGGPIKRLLSVVSNVAWDMSVPRFMERMLPTKLQGDYTIPFFLSFDRALCETIRAFPIKAAVLDSQSGTVESLPETNSFAYFEREGCGEIFREFSSPDNRLERLSRQVAEPEEILRRIRTEYREVTRLLG